MDFSSFHAQRYTANEFEADDMPRVLACGRKNDSDSSISEKEDSVVEHTINGNLEKSNIKVEYLFTYGKKENHLSFVN